ncbi:hypothetical protein EJB05_27165 [Eragrostis curvula]|uniref:Uncharacterized protein n=1 Tax=Eragrostis curvula TaxID=38414 RepID=A0A5J9ULS9_9POAL|nr:hypothetical protein EJB05_27165 [Eragrostis curvula]
MELREAGYKICCLASSATVPTNKLADPASGDDTLDGVLPGCANDFHVDFKSVPPILCVGNCLLTSML